MIDLSKAKLRQNYSEMSQVEKVHTIIPVARPPKTAFFRVNPDLGSLGTSNLDFANGIIKQIVNTGSQGKTSKSAEDDINFMLSIELRDHLETMFEAQNKGRVL
jgi:hypothetical protein